MNKKLSLNEEGGFWQKWKDHKMVRSFLYVFLGIVLYVLLLGHVVPDVVKVNVGSVAHEDIVSPVTVIDVEATNQAKEDAAKAVEPVYTQDNTISDHQINKLNRLFLKIKDTLSDEDLSAEEKVEKLKEEDEYQLDDEAYETLVNYTVEDIETMQVVTRDIVSRIMYEGVREEDNGLQRARQEVDESLVFSTLDSQLRAVSREIARQSIVPNFMIDWEETQYLRQEARDNVQEIEIREGEVLVEEGEIITRETYRKLAVVGMLNESRNWFPYLGLALFIGIMLTFLGVYISTSRLPIKTNNNHLLMFVLIFILNLVVMKVISIGQILEYTGIGFVAPVAFATMLMTTLLHQRLAVFSSFIFGLIAGVMLNAETPGYFDHHYGLAVMFSGAAGAFFLGQATRKTKILQAGFVVSIVTMLTVVASTFLRSAPPGWLDLSLYILFAFFSGILASVLTIGLMPFFEAAFGILSPMKLVELSSPNNPLLRKILIEAPGTYHHSVMVANLAEAAAEAVGGNGLLARVGAYYHDIGKTKRPHFFVENQMNMGNPHDKIAPQLSAKIIIAHVKDGKQMLKDHRLPKAIQDIAEQHHGTTLIKYFYHEAQKESSSEVNESDFRYPGPKAQFKESAIVGVADAVEAAVRSLSKPTPERIEHLVRTIIRDRLEDGQFHECDLTLKELNTIANAICETLKGTFHSRIEYPEEFQQDKAKKDHVKKKKAEKKPTDQNEK